MLEEFLLIWCKRKLHVPWKASYLQDLFNSDRKFWVLLQISCQAIAAGIVCNQVKIIPSQHQLLVSMPQHLHKCEADAHHRKAFPARNPHSRGNVGIWKSNMWCCNQGKGAVSNTSERRKGPGMKISATWLFRKSHRNNLNTPKNQSRYSYIWLFPKDIIPASFSSNFFN